MGCVQSPTFQVFAVHAGRNPEAAIQALDSNYRNYRLIERNLLQSKARLMGKLPEIQKAEEAVVLLLRKREADQDVCCCKHSCCIHKPEHKH